MNERVPAILDDTEPQAGSVAVPIWLVILFGILFFSAQLYLDRYAGGFKKEVYEPYGSLKELTAMHPKGAGDELYVKGGKVYVTYCSPCHQPSGMGAPGIAPPLASSEWVTTEGPGRVIRIILHGLTGPIKVKGVDWNLSMVPWKDTLNDEDIAAVATFVRQNKDWAHNASVVTPEQVKTIRDKEAARSSSWTGPEILAIPDTE